MAKKPQKQEQTPSRRVVTSNRKAYHDYEIAEKHEAGIVLVGSEVKSVFNGKVNLQEAYCVVTDDELWLVGCYIAPYEKVSYGAAEPRRNRKLLMHKKEIRRIEAKAQEKSFTIVPLSVYFLRGRVKVEIGLARGKRQYDKRRQIAERESQRERERAASRRE